MSRTVLPTMSLTERMKGYEDISRIYLTKRTPVIIRLDMKCGSNWTSSLNNKFDIRMSNWMKETVKYAMDEIQGSVFAFSVSDEISLFLRDWDKLTTAAWFDNNLQKIVSVSASIITAKFNEAVKDSGYRLNNGKLAHFDSRAFILPKEEVVNYFIYRQHDGLRNSVSAYANHIFGHKAVQGKNVVDMKSMLQQNGTPWEELSTVFRHGFAIKKDESQITTELPLFKDDRSYIEELVYVKPE